MSTFKYNRLDKTNAAVLLVDHQSGLTNSSRISRRRLQEQRPRAGRLRQIFKLPTILTTSFEDGPNGPLVPELKEIFPDAPYIARPGNINAWDNEDFVKAVKATGKKQLLIAGIVTEVCVAFPALSALEEGYEVFVVTDASGTFNKTTRDAAWSRMEAAAPAHELVRRRLRTAPRLAQRHRRPRRAVLEPLAVLPLPDQQLHGRTSSREEVIGVPLQNLNGEDQPLPPRIDPRAGRHAGSSRTARGGSMSRKSRSPTALGHRREWGRRIRQYPANMKTRLTKLASAFAVVRDSDHFCARAGESRSRVPPQSNSAESARCTAARSRPSSGECLRSTTSGCCRRGDRQRRETEPGRYWSKPVN